jgi:hypothetical protein
MRKNQPASTRKVGQFTRSHTPRTSHSAQVIFRLPLVSEKVPLLTKGATFDALYSRASALTLPIR